MAANGVRRCRAAGRNWRADHAGVIGADSAALIMMLACKSTSPPCLTIPQRCSKCCARWSPRPNSSTRTLQQRDAEIDKLQLLIKRLLRQQFGRRSEQLSADQLQLALEDLEQTVAANEAAQDAAENNQRQRRADTPQPQPRGPSGASAAL